MEDTDTKEILDKLSADKIQKIIEDPAKAAAAVELIYVSDSQPGISREKKGKSFNYQIKGEVLKNKADLDRIKKLVLPPAWENVWICRLPNGHLQATGFDAMKRKQYRYHPLWTSLRNNTKFYRMLEFANALPDIRNRVEHDLSLPGMPLEKILATVINLLELTSIRVGNNSYERLYGSFGLTTLKNKHIKINGSQVRFSFKGKKGINHVITLRNKRLARIVQQSKDIPGKELFQYYDESGSPHPIDSGLVNNYLREISGSDFTAKDFRTWAGTINAFLALKEIGISREEGEIQKNVLAAIDKVANLLGNTRAVCRKYYVHPHIISLYESGSLEKFFNDPEDESKKEKEKEKGLLPDEQIVVSILKAY